MNLFLLEGTVCFFYFASSLFLIKDVKKKRQKKTALILASIAATGHASSILLSAWNKQTIDFGFFHTASIISAIIVFLLLISSFSKPVEKLGIALFPLAAFMLALDYAFPDLTPIQTEYSLAMNTHILSSIVAFCLLTIAAFQALLLAIQNNQLKSPNPGRLMLSFPPLQAMESLLFQMISAGVLFLSISLVSGFIFIDDLFAQHLAHKTILSILAWLTFSALLLGKKLYGWRGRTAIHWTLYGFLTLLLAYFGSKFVLEILLNKV